MRAPFPWFGGKRSIAADIWRAFGDGGSDTRQEVTT